MPNAPDLSFRYRHSWSAIVEKLQSHIPPDLQEDIAYAVALLDENDRQGEDFLVSEVGGGDAQPWTPTVRQAGIAITLGNGTLVGKYRRQGDWIDADIEFVVGSTTAFGGTGAMSWDLPPGDLPPRLSMAIGTVGALIASNRFAYVAFLGNNTTSVNAIDVNVANNIISAGGVAGDEYHLTLRYYAPRS